MARRRALRLSTRVALFFGFIALLGGITLAVVTFGFVRSSLVDQRASEARSQASLNAQAVRQTLRDFPDDILAYIETELRPEGDGFAVLSNPEKSTDPQFTLDDLPGELVTAVIGGRSGQQQFGLRGEPYLAVGYYIGEFDTAYFEAFPLTSTEGTLRTIVSALLVGAGGTTLLATFFGWSTSRRMLRPITLVADAAGEIASGDLDTRLEPANDPDLDRLAGSFNEMADAVQLRIEREARFASDVSHELRSPITALSAAIEVLDARRDDLPERTQQALDVVVSQVRRFDSMVIDLLELSRLDAGATDLNLESVDLPELCHRVATRTGFHELPIDVARGGPRRTLVDRVRFERILANLLDNAEIHGGGPLRISIEPGGASELLLVVEDGGPGVASSERVRIFERFARGSAARHRIGTGLGLALVAEHAAALGGQAWVEDRPGGGARFVVSFSTVGA